MLTISRLQFVLLAASLCGLLAPAHAGQSARGGNKAAKPSRKAKRTTRKHMRARGPKNSVDRTVFREKILAARLERFKEQANPYVRSLSQFIEANTRQYNAHVVMGTVKGRRGKEMTIVVGRDGLKALEIERWGTYTKSIDARELSKHEIHIGQLRSVVREGMNRLRKSSANDLRAVVVVPEYDR